MKILFPNYTFFVCRPGFLYSFNQVHNLREIKFQERATPHPDSFVDKEISRFPVEEDGVDVKIIACELTRVLAEKTERDRLLNVQKELNYLEKICDNGGDDEQFSNKN